jgi:TRAP-type mannitol/chloroaromatic compound transport system permease small subunit
MDGVMKSILNLLDSISIWSGKAAAWLILPVIVVVSYEIVARYVFKSPTIWAVETMIYGCALIYVLCSAWVTQDGRHVRIDMLYERLKPRTKAVVDSITFIAFLLYITFLLWASYKYAYKSTIIWEESDSPWRPPLWPMKISLALGVALVLLQGISNWLRDVYFAITGKTL